MDYRKFGKTERTISRIGLGCWAIGGHGWGAVDDANSREAVRAAVEAGIDFFDTADVYGFGHSETLLGEALGSDRDKAVIATKFGVRWDESGRIARDISPAYARTAVAASLKRLKIDCIPLYQIHWPDGRTPLADTLEALDRLRDEGKIRWIGLSNFPVDAVREAQGRTRLESSQFEYSLLERGAEASDLPLCLEFGMAGLTYGSLAKGLLSGKFSENDSFAPDDNRSRDKHFRPDVFPRNVALARRLADVGRAYGKSAGQVAVRWLLEQDGVTTALVGAKSRAQVLDNAGAASWKLTCDDLRAVAAMFPSEKP